jgi:hypothetical protein
MQAQLDQGGHKETFATMPWGMRNAIQWGKRRKITAECVDGGTLLIGRGQGKCVSAILASELVMPFGTKTFHTPASLKSPYPLPHVLNVQIKYDLHSQ